MDCREAGLAYLRVEEEGLTAPEAQALRSHLAACEACRALAEEERALSASLSAWASARLAARGGTPSAPAKRVRRVGRRRRGGGSAWAAAAGVLLALGAAIAFALGAFGPEKRGNSPGSARPADSPRDLATEDGSPPTRPPVPAPPPTPRASPPSAPPPSAPIPVPDPGRPAPDAPPSPPPPLKPPEKPALAGPTPPVAPPIPEAPPVPPPPTAPTAPTAPDTPTVARPRAVVAVASGAWNRDGRAWKDGGDVLEGTRLEATAAGAALSLPTGHVLSLSKGATVDARAPGEPEGSAALRVVQGTGVVEAPIDSKTAVLAFGPATVTVAACLAGFEADAKWLRLEVESGEASVSGSGPAEGAPVVVPAGSRLAWRADAAPKVTDLGPKGSPIVNSKIRGTGMAVAYGADFTKGGADWSGRFEGKGDDRRLEAAAIGDPDYGVQAESPATEGVDLFRIVKGAVVRFRYRAERDRPFVVNAFSPSRKDNLQFIVERPVVGRWTTVEIPFDRFRDAETHREAPREGEGIFRLGFSADAPGAADGFALRSVQVLIPAR